MIIKTDKEIIESYTVDSSNYRGTADKVLIPADEAEVIDIFKEYYPRNIKITFSGAGTGLTGGRVADGGVVLSSEKFNKILDFNENSSTIKVQPAVTNGEIADFLEEKGYFLPPNPTERTAGIGGNVSTNASGSRTYLYGAIRKYVQELRIILPSCEIINLNRAEKPNISNKKFEIRTEGGDIIKLPVLDYKIPEIKHSAGYYSSADLHPIDYFIGAEGTLGFISEITLNFIEKPDNILGLIIFFDKIDNCISFVEHLQKNKISFEDERYRANANPNPRLIEFFDGNSLRMLREKYTQLNENAEAAVWIEQEIYGDFDEIIGNWYELITEYTNLADETWSAQTKEEHIKFRDFRHTLPEKVYELITRNNQYKVGVDGAVPIGFLKDLYYLIENNSEKYQLDRVIYGHIGNNHLHGNVFYKNSNEEINAENFYNETITQILKMNGTVSAEHGIGKLKVKYLYQMFGEEILKQMVKLKSTLDPKNLLNYGNLFL